MKVPRLMGFLLLGTLLGLRQRLRQEAGQALKSDVKPDARYVLALEQARRNLDRQADFLKEIRGRATALLGFAGVAVTLIFGLALRGNAALGGLSWAALAAFAVLAAMVFIISWPRGVTFIFDAEGILGWAEVDKADIDGMNYQLVRDMHWAYGHNNIVLDRFTNLYSASVIVLVIEVILLVLDLRGR
jgi:hypothetical protein